MKKSYEINANIIKALSDWNRVRIVDILSCGEKCACDILKDFDFTQPTLSHHMKVLVDCGLVEYREDGLWRHYSINKTTRDQLLSFLDKLMSKKENCICNNKNIKCKYNGGKV